jgi:hypothetical protein
VPRGVLLVGLALLSFLTAVLAGRLLLCHCASPSGG